MPKRSDILLTSRSPLGGEQPRPRAQHKGRGVGGKLTSNARSMRKSPTEAERRLWRCLSNKQLGYKFRRQHPMGAQYIADFICLERKLIIELDGSQHAEQKKEYDDQRTVFLHAEGYRVLRFWNNDVLKNTQDVCKTILHALEFTPHGSATPRLLPPKGGAEGTAHA